MIDFDLSAEQEGVRDAARAYAGKHVAPAAAAIDADNRCPSSVLDAAAAGHLTAVAVPRADGGGGVDFASALLAVEAVAYASAGVALRLATQNLAAAALHRFGDETVRAKWLPRVASGQEQAAVLVWRAEGHHSVRADNTPAGLRLSGEAGLVPNAASAHLFLVAAASPDPDAGASSSYIVADGTGGLTRTAASDPLGARGAEWADVRLDGLTVDDAGRLGTDAGGTDLATWVLDRGRVLMAGVAIGVAQAALDWAIRQVRDGGVPDSQAVRFTLADVAVQLDAARILTLKAATLEPGDRQDAGAAMAKLTASEAARLVTDHMLELTGARGFTRKAIIERLWRDARAVDVLLGSTYAQRRTIAKEILP